MNFIFTYFVCVVLYHLIHHKYFTIIKDVSASLKVLRVPILNQVYFRIDTYMIMVKG